jgi:pyruvate ferredoxin oxidoreductase beta subunit
MAKAKAVKGTSYIHVFVPCPTGWGYPAHRTVSLAKAAVDSGLWYLAEYEAGEFKLNRNPESFTPAADYLLAQSRFKHLTEEDISRIEAQRDAKWEIMRRKWLG